MDTSLRANTSSHSKTISNYKDPFFTRGPDSPVWRSFRDVCIAIREFAFISSDLPVIVRLDISAGGREQFSAANIIQKEWGAFLFHATLEGYGSRPELLRLDDLRKRILIDLLPTKKRFNRIFSRELEKLGNWMREERFLTFPSTKELLSQYGADSDMTRTPFYDWELPTIVRSNLCHVLHPHRNKDSHSEIENRNPILIWAEGIQMAAIDRHHVDTGMMINHAMFADGSGWVLKPENYSSPFGDGNLPLQLLHHLSVFVFADQRFRIGHDEVDLSSLFTADLHIFTRNEGTRSSVERYFGPSSLPDCAAFVNFDHRDEPFKEDERDPLDRGYYINLINHETSLPKLSFVR